MNTSKEMRALSLVQRTLFGINDCGVYSQELKALTSIRRDILKKDDEIRVLAKKLKSANEEIEYLKAFKGRYADLEEKFERNEAFPAAAIAAFKSNANDEICEIIDVSDNEDTEPHRIITVNPGEQEMEHSEEPTVESVTELPESVYQVILDVSGTCQQEQDGADSSVRSRKDTYTSEHAGSVNQVVLDCHSHICRQDQYGTDSAITSHEATTLHSTTIVRNAQVSVDSDFSEAISASASILSEKEQELPQEEREHILERAQQTKRKAAERRKRVGRDTYVCQSCWKTCKNLYDLRAHERIHTGEKPFKCPECNYSSATKSNLKSHLRRHAAERPHSCPNCEKTYKNKHNLDYHMRVHSGEKPYKCPECSFSSASISNLKEHGLKHTEERPYSCPDCGKTYKSKRCLSLHTNRKHWSKPCDPLCRQK